MRDNRNPYHQMSPSAPQPSCEAISVLTQQQDQALRWGVEAKQCVVLQGWLLGSAAWSGKSEVNVVCGVQSQESNVPPGYGVGWNPPPVLDESVGIWSVSASIGNGWAGRRLGLGEQSPLLCDAPSTQRCTIIFLSRT